MLADAADGLTRAYLRVAGECAVAPLDVAGALLTTVLDAATAAGLGKALRAFDLLGHLAVGEKQAVPPLPRHLLPLVDAIAALCAAAEGAFPARKIAPLVYDRLVTMQRLLTRFVCIYLPVPEKKSPSQSAF